jgi:hypothetical protein
MLFNERLHKSEDGPHVEPSVRLLVIARIGISLADLRPQQTHVIDELPLVDLYNELEELQGMTRRSPSGCILPSPLSS